MTLPNERYRAIKNARDFLRSLLDPKQTPKVPRAIRREAYYALKHFPLDYELETIAKNSPELLEPTKDSKLCASEILGKPRKN
jgi:hypothetical protein